ncbi:MAG: UDP-N-acetylmuramate dehydrogenase [Calditrichaeota bacterium]|nr:UDP-N-acetylmuramate dehydrogenase [Calditrichota bacterium]MCB9391058.1 UDP-N-acetylmuramate dehydrogenase [Calditrichota bacterium]
MIDIAGVIAAHAPCELRADAPLAPLTTFRVGGPAKVLAEPKTSKELIGLLELIRANGIPYFLLGLGSNLLVSDTGFDGVVIRLRGELASIRMDRGDCVAGPGARLFALTTFAAENSLSGIEPLSGIPGSVGGGLWMNAGAYGGEISDTFVEADVLTKSLRQERLTNSQISFGYRSAPELKDMIVLESRYRLKQGDQSSIYGEMRRVWRLRKEKQPIEFPSAGSIFKRPPNDFAGRLIEATGCKGLRVGGAIVSEKHAGIFVNDRRASALDIATLIREVRRRIKKQFGILLETEILPVGYDSDPFAV